MGNPPEAQAKEGWPGRLAERHFEFPTSSISVFAFLYIYVRVPLTCMFTFVDLFHSILFHEEESFTSSLTATSF